MLGSGGEDAVGGGGWEYSGEERKDRYSIRLQTAAIEISVKLACIAGPKTVSIHQW